jgi:hypothetical protein
VFIQHKTFILDFLTCVKDTCWQNTYIIISLLFLSEYIFFFFSITIQFQLIENKNCLGFPLIAKKSLLEEKVSTNPNSTNCPFEIAYF